MEDKNGGLSRCKGTKKSGLLGEIKAKNKWKQSEGIASEQKRKTNKQTQEEKRKRGKGPNSAEFKWIVNIILKKKQ